MLTAALKANFPSFMKIISSSISPSYIKNSFFLEIEGIKLLKTSAIKTELLLFLKNLKFNIYVWYIVNKILFFKENGKFPINEFISYFSIEWFFFSK